VRPDDASGLRGEVLAVDYLGTTQIVTIVTARGMVRARLPAETRAVVGETVGLALRPEKLSVFDAATGLALRSVLHEAAHG
jgi:multiple sugar transport system ATP-binding protein